MAERPFINLRVLKNRSVGGGCVLMTVLGAVSFGSIYVIPVYCAQIQGYNAEQIGYVVMWSGLPQLVLFPAMPFLMKRFDPRLLVIAGTLLFALSCFINVALTHDVGMDQLILPQLLRAAGQPLFTVPLSQMSTAGLPPRDTADASALSNMMRNLGGSIGIAMLSTMIDRREHMHFSVLAEAMTRNAALTQSRLATLTRPCRPMSSTRWRRAPRRSPPSPARRGARPMSWPMPTPSGSSAWASSSASPPWRCSRSPQQASGPIEAH